MDANDFSVEALIRVYSRPFAVKKLPFSNSIENFIIQGSQSIRIQGTGFFILPRSHRGTERDPFEFLFLRDLRDFKKMS